MDLDTIADELYSLTPSEFTATRDRRAGEARRAGDRTLAETVKKLRRPTVGAWLTNLLAHRRPDEVGQLLSLGGQLREAQESLSAAELRRLSGQRRQVVAALSSQARQLAATLGQEISDAAVREMETTLEAALADEGAAEAVRSGRLTTALQYSGFGPVDLSGAVAASAGGRGAASVTSHDGTFTKKRTDSAGANESEQKPALGSELSRKSVAERRRQERRETAEQQRRRQERRETAEQQLAEAEASVKGARHQAAEEEAKLKAAQEQHDRSAAEAAELERQLQQLREQEAEAARGLRQAQKAHDAAEAVLRRAEAALERAGQSLTELT